MVDGEELGFIDVNGDVDGIFGLKNKNETRINS